MCDLPRKCAYTVAKNTAIKSTLAVANVAYFLTIANYQNEFTNEPLLIVDEADVLENELMNFIEVVISRKHVAMLGLGKPKLVTKPESWLEWIRQKAVPRIHNEIKHVTKDDVAEMTPGEKKEYRALANALMKLRLIGGWDRKRWEWVEDYEITNWILDGYREGRIVFKPVKVDELAREFLWTHGQKWLLMSASIISAQQMAQDLGLEPNEWRSVSIGSTFPVERRPLYVDPTANMTFAAMRDTDAKKIMLSRIRKLVDWHSDDRVLVHAVSYPLAKYLASGLKHTGRVITYTNARDREGALAAFRASENGVAVAASWDRGVDLPGDECRVQIIPKVPYPALGDKQTSTRLHSKGGQGWFSMLTARTMVQMTGRAMRSEDDFCETYILDQQFITNVYRKNRYLLPEWWQEALVMGGSPKERRR
jgi:Rad3-related DNA helicase